jgi:hypothetical protein
MLPLRALPEAALADLVWVEPTGRFLNYVFPLRKGPDELRAGDDTVAVLEYDLEQRTAMGHCAEGYWYFQPGDFRQSIRLGQHVEISSEESWAHNRSIATFRGTAVVEGSGLLTFAGGRSFRYYQRFAWDGQTPAEFARIGSTAEGSSRKGVKAGLWFIEDLEAEEEEPLWWARSVAGAEDQPERLMHIAVSATGLAAPELQIALLLDKFLLWLGKFRRID